MSAILAILIHWEITTEEKEEKPVNEEFNLFTELEDNINSDIADRLRKTDLNTLTPIKAINLVWELKGMLANKD